MDFDDFYTVKKKNQQNFLNEKIHVFDIYLLQDILKQKFWSLVKSKIFKTSNRRKFVNKHKLCRFGSDKTKIALINFFATQQWRIREKG